LYTFKRDLAYTQTKTLEVSPPDWELMKKYMVRPENFEKDAFVIYEDWLANNFVDRDRERFPKAVLENFSRTMPGKSKMIGHQRGEPGEGVYYKSELQRVSVDEAVEIVNLAGGHPTPEDFVAMLKEVETRDGGIFWLVATFYMFADDPLVKYIDAGIKKRSSIGFGAEKRVEITDEDGHTMWYEYQGMGEGREGSIVWLESQYGSAIRKDAGDDENKQVLDLKTKVGELEPFVKATWTTAYTNSLEDNCFAVIEPGGKKDDTGRTVPRNARHLPHHAKGNGASGTGGTVDLPHLKNGLARMNQVKPVLNKITTEELRSRAKRHLVAHARKLELGDYARCVFPEELETLKCDMRLRRKDAPAFDFLFVEDRENEGKPYKAVCGVRDDGSRMDVGYLYETKDWTEDEVKKQTASDFEMLKISARKTTKKGDMNMDKYFQVKELGIKSVIDAEDLEATVEAVQTEVSEKVKKMDEELTEANKVISDVQEIFGEDFSVLKEIKEGYDSLKEALVEEEAKYAVLIGALDKDDEEAIKNHKEAMAKKPVAEIKELLDQHIKVRDASKKKDGVLSENTNEPQGEDGKVVTGKPVNPSAITASI